MPAEHERSYGLGMDAFVSVCSGNATVIMVWGMNALVSVCSGSVTVILVWGMDALVSVCSRNTNVIMVWAWMLWSAYALGARTVLWFGHGCFG